MSKSKSTVPSMVSCSFVYHSHRHRQCALKTLFSDALSPLATKIGQLGSSQLEGAMANAGMYQKCAIIVYQKCTVSAVHFLEVPELYISSI